jgi:hypothetical protein
VNSTELKTFRPNVLIYVGVLISLWLSDNKICKESDRKRKKKENMGEQGRIKKERRKDSKNKTQNERRVRK